MLSIHLKFQWKVFSITYLRMIKCSKRNIGICRNKGTFVTRAYHHSTGCTISLVVYGLKCENPYIIRSIFNWITTAPSLKLSVNVEGAKDQVRTVNTYSTVWFASTFRWWNYCHRTDMHSGFADHVKPYAGDPMSTEDLFTRSMISKFVKLKETMILLVLCFQHLNHFVTNISRK